MRTQFIYSKLHFFVFVFPKSALSPHVLRSYWTIQLRLFMPTHRAAGSVIFNNILITWRMAQVVENIG